MIEMISILIGTITLIFSVGWTFWFYKKQQIQKLNLYLDEEVFHNFHSDMYFSLNPIGPDDPIGPENKKMKKVPRGSIVQTMVTLKVHNIGTTPATINKFVAKVNESSITIPLDNLWLLTGEKDEDKLPKVLLPGQFWNGFIDWVALKISLEKKHGIRAFWDITISCIDTNNRRHSSTHRYSDNGFRSIIDRIKNSPSDLENKDKNY